MKQTDMLPSSLLDPNWVQISQTAELFGTWGTLLAFSTKRGRGACRSFEMGLGRGQVLVTYSNLHQTNQQVG
jgi:hypothetical protein